MVGYLVIWEPVASLDAKDMVDGLHAHPCTSLPEARRQTLREKCQPSFSVTWTHPLFQELFISTDFSMSVAHCTFPAITHRYLWSQQECLISLQSPWLSPRVGRALWSPGARSTRPGPASSPGPTQPSPEDTALTRCAPALLSRSSWLHICLLQTVQHSPTEMLHNYTPCLHSVVFLGLKLQILNYEPFGPVHLFSVLVVWFLFSTKHKLIFPWMLFPLPFYLWNMTFALTGYSGMHS